MQISAIKTSTGYERLIMDKVNEKEYPFFAMLDRMQYINRWGLMRNQRVENIKEHSMDVAVLAQALALIRNKLCLQGRVAVDPHFVASIALFHDASEIITGDLPTPVKYKNNEIEHSFKKIEEQAQKSLLDMLPDFLKEEYSLLFTPDTSNPENQAAEELVKAADKISAYIKCLVEENAGNKEFLSAKETIMKAILAYELPEVDYFLRHFIPSFGKTLDQISV